MPRRKSKFLRAANSRRMRLRSLRTGMGTWSGISAAGVPGMYLLAHLAYRVVPSFRWMDLFPCLFVYAGLAIFLYQVTPLFARTRSQLCLLLLATLHPQLLLWRSEERRAGK